MKYLIAISLILVFNQNYKLVDNIEFEKLLGEHISFTKRAIGNDFKNKFLSENHYFIDNESIRKIFYGMSYNFMTIRSNQDDIVQTISIHFRKVIDRSFFESFVVNYGKPDNIQIIKNRHTISEDIVKDENGKTIQTLRKSDGDLIEGSFEDKPIFIIWKKEGYEIKAFIRHEMNISEITFKVAN